MVTHRKGTNGKRTEEELEKLRAYTASKNAKPNIGGTKWTPEQIQGFADSLIAWAKDESHLTLYRWSIDQGMCDNWLELTEEHHPILKEAHNKARKILSDRFIDKSFYAKKNGVDAYFAEKYLPMHDKAYKALLKERAEWSKNDKSVDSSTEITITRKSFRIEPKIEPINKDIDDAE